jgi:hypothetical protein
MAAPTNVGVTSVSNSEVQSLEISAKCEVKFLVNREGKYAKGAVFDPTMEFSIRGKGSAMLKFTELEAIPGCRHLHASGSLETGERAAAADDIHLMLRLGDAAGSDPILISMLVRVAIHSIAASTDSSGIPRLTALATAGWLMPSALATCPCDNPWAITHNHCQRL